MRVVIQKRKKMFMLFTNSCFMNRPGVFSKIFEKKFKKEEIPLKEDNSHA